jgi:hypothetical protein
MGIITWIVLGLGAGLPANVLKPSNVRNCVRVIDYALTENGEAM